MAGAGSAGGVRGERVVAARGGAGPADRHFDFGFTDRATLTVYLSVIIRKNADGWQISHYQVSHLD